MTTLPEKLKQLEQVLDGLDDVRSQEQTAKALTELTATVTNRRARLARTASAYRDPGLPGSPGATVPKDRWPKAAAKLEELSTRLRTAPETVRDDQLWRDTEATVTSLLRDVENDVRERWSRIRRDHRELDTTFLAALPPGTQGVDEYRELVTDLRALLDKDAPAFGDADRAARMWDQLDKLRAKLDEHKVPAEVEADLALLLEGRLPYDRYGGELKAYVERSGLAARVRVGLSGA